MNRRHQQPSDAQSGYRHRPPGTADTSAAASTQKQKQKQLNEMIEMYMANVMASNKKSSDALEMEVRFGTGGVRAITHRDHANVIERLLSAGFKATSSGNYHLRINYESDVNAETSTSTSTSTSTPQISNIRFEIDGMTNIQNYCATDALDLAHLKCTKKMNAQQMDADGKPVKDDRGHTTYIKPVKFDDFNFKVSLQNERAMRHESAEVDPIIKRWPQIKKTFRHMKRTSFAHPDSPIRFDISVVKESKRYPPPNTWRMESTYTFEQANVADSSPKYEIEIEIDNSRIGPGKFVDSGEALAILVRQAIKLVLSGLQGTNFPVSYYPEIQSVCNDYHYLLHHSNPDADERDKHHHRDDDDDAAEEKMLRTLELAAGDYRNKENKRLTTRNFVGPSSVTLQRCNISSTFTRDRTTGIPNIRFNYTVTEKADGQRKMLFINRIGRAYLIDTAMNVQFTGMVCKDEKLHWSLLDGEHILHDTHGNFINLYAAFDIYFVRKMDIRHLAFAFQHGDTVSNSSKFRLYFLNLFMVDVDNTFHSVVPASEHGITPPLRMIAKRFRVASKNDPIEIFECCEDILARTFAYNTDGLIFTPADTGVGMSRVGGIAPRERSTWPLSFKWKPAEHNTIDFLVTTEKREDRHEIIHEKPGITTCDDSPVIKYKTLTLRVGYSSDRDRYSNPMQTMLDGSAVATTAPLPDDPPSAAAPFYPTMPPDTTAHVCNIILQNVDGVYQMRAESGDTFTDKSVVEFRYDMDREPGFKWVPIKVRHDKTLARELGNSFHVANDNWFSIHYPVTEGMLVSEARIEEAVDPGVYYQKTVSSHSATGKRRLIDLASSQPLRDFHNLYVKRELLFGVCKPGKTLIDLAVGKGGDIQKWIEAKLHFVFGLDVSEDNIINLYDGAYARCVKCAEKTPLDKGDKFPFMVFARGDSGKLIRSRSHSSAADSGENAFMAKRSSSASTTDTSMYKAIADTVFGEGNHDPKIVGRELMKHQGVGRDGFDVCSVQFALHYFWKDVETLHTFMRNVSECTKEGGYFVGTCFDGRRMFDMLKKYTTTYPMVYEDDAPSDKRRIILSVMKKYDNAEYHDDETSIGYAIDVFQESINSTHTEYLVNMVYLERIMRNYGFVLVQRDVAKRDLLLPSGMGSFNELYEMMCTDMSYNIRGLEGEMTETLKTISFMNNYFAFQKVQQVDAKRVSEAFIKNNGVDLVAAEAAIHAAESDVKPVSAVVMEKARKKIDGVDYMMDGHGQLFKPSDMNTSVGKFDAKRKEINFVSETHAHEHRTQKAAVAEKKRLKLEADVLKHAKNAVEDEDVGVDVAPLKLNPNPLNNPKAAAETKPQAKQNKKSPKKRPSTGDDNK